jgi:hypothetical protein
MNKLEQARLVVKRLWVLACKFDNIPPAAKFVSLSSNNPYDKPYNLAMENYQREAWKAKSIAL